MKLVKPWPDGYTINKKSPYGWRVHPITRKRTFHHGVDVALPIGTPLTAPADGVVVHKGVSPSGGNTLIIKHADDLYTVYYHLQKPSHRGLPELVKAGDLIAYSGNTGASTGPHLHWEVRKSRKWGDTTDPEPFLAKTEAAESPVSAEQDPPKGLGSPKKPTPEKPAERPMSARLSRWFQIRRALK